GKIGPLLIAEKERPSFEGDGGDNLQVNEVLIGSAWLYVSMLDYYDMHEESEEVARALNTLLYEDSGLQFRTPAAVNGEREFRAPMNMRPLSVWLLDMNRNIAQDKEGKIV
ncbi:MAG: GH116 family glycosyl hydrolase, partial [Bacteroidales bacterium]|nr:GH116 family glycosyl hydrolase [Bacteroidales bacterium]